MPGKKKHRKPVSLILNEWLYEASRKLGAGFAAVSDFVERLIGEGLAGSGKSVGKLFGRIPWGHVVAAGKPLAAVGKLGRAPFVWLYQRLAWLADRLLPKWLLRVLVWPFTTVGHAIYFAIDFAGLWWWTREFKKLLWAIPAFVLAAPLIACIILSPLYSRSAKIVRYQQTMRDAIDSENQALADLCVAKLNQLGLHQREHLEYNAALALASKGQFDAAVEQMQRLAPETAPGFVHAHTWLALQLWEGTLPEQEGAKWKRFEKHVRHALAADAEDLLARRLLIEVDLRQGKTEQAVQAMQALAGAFPDLHYRLMRYYQARGDVVNARARARETVAYSTQLANGESAKVNDFRQRAAALEQLDQVDAAIDVLDEGLRQHPGEAELTRGLADVLLAAFWKDVDLRPQAAYARLARAVKLRPANNRVLVFLANQLADGQPEAARFLEKVDLDTAQALRSQTVLLAGDVAFRRRDYRLAMEFYRQGSDIDAQASRGWNNMAWILGNIEPIQLSEALLASNHALELDANNPEFRETRGQIFLKLGRWEEAAGDLRRALNGDLPNVAEVHRALATAYEQMGQREQAAAHRQLAGG